MVEYRKLSRHTGAEIVGIELSTPLPQSTIDEIWRIFVEHCVVLFRDQNLDQQQLVRATEQFGKCPAINRPKEIQTSGQKSLLPQIMLITNIREDGKPIGAHPDGEMWFHHDTIHREIPSKATLLYALEIPTYGGNTSFSNLFAAYDALPPDLRTALDGRRALNVFSYGANSRGDPHATNTQSSAIHPIIRRHDDNGRKAIYADRLMTHHLIDVPRKESDAILDRLFDFIERDEFIYEHQWRRGDLVMWDNGSSIHARRDFPADQVRLMWRTTIAGEKRPE